MLYTFQCVLHTLLSMSPFPFYQSHPKAGAVNEIIRPCFCKRFTIGQRNVQAATAEDEEQYSLKQYTLHFKIAKLHSKRYIN